MYSKIIALSLLAGAATANLSVDKVSFEAFVKQYHPLVSEGSSEWNERKQLFEASISQIREHNSKKSSYKMGLNKFSASTTSEKAVVLGRRADMERVHEPKKLISGHDFDMKPVSELPTHIDWREKGLASATKDQGHCGSCFAFAAAGMLEDYLYLSSGLMYNLSPQMAASCTPNPEHCGGSGGCNGGTAEIVFDHLANGGGKMSQV
jgi:cathepsin L